MQQNLKNLDLPLDPEPSRWPEHLRRDVNRYHSWLEFSTGRKWPKGLAADRWMNEVYAPAVAGLSALCTGEACH